MNAAAFIKKGIENIIPLHTQCAVGLNPEGQMVLLLEEFAGVKQSFPAMGKRTGGVYWHMVMPLAQIMSEYGSPAGDALLEDMQHSIQYLEWEDIQNLRHDMPPFC